jgi:chitin synthase
MDDFSWGNTRVVVGEGNNKKVVIDDDEKYDDSMIPLKRFSGTYTQVAIERSAYPASQNTKPRRGRHVPT